MNITLEMFLGKLKNFSFKTDLLNNSSVVINAIKILPNNLSFIEKNILYIDNMSRLNKILPFIPSDIMVNILIVEDTTYDESTIPSNLNIILLNSDIKLAELYSEITDICLSQLIGKNTINLLNALLEEKGIQNIIKTAYKLIGNPIIISDLSHKVLAYIPDTDFGDSLWNEIVRTGYKTYSFIMDANADRLFDRIKNSEMPFIYRSDDFTKIYAKISIGKKMIGYITVAEKLKSFGVEDIKTTDILCNIICQEMQKDKFYNQPKGQIFEFFITDLLENNLQDNTIIEERMKYLNLEFQKNIYLITIRPKIDSSKISSISDIQKKDIDRYGESIIYNNDIVLLSSFEDSTMNPEEHLSGLYNRMSKGKMAVGISRRVDSLANIRKAYDQSLKAIEIGRKIYTEKNVYTYEDCAAYDFILSHSKKENLYDFCHPSILLLKEYDKQNNTDLMKTLYFYLLKDKKLKEISNILNIHRNTLTGRIDKIIEVIKLDLNNPDIEFHLLLTFKIMMLMNDDDFVLKV